MKIVTASNKKQSLKITNAEWEAIGKKAGWFVSAARLNHYVIKANTSGLKKTADLSVIDKNTLTIGKIGTLPQAKKVCYEKARKLPRPGYEITIDSGTVSIDMNHPGTVWHGKHLYEYKTYLVNEGGQFRVWSWISVNPTVSQDVDTPVNNKV